MKFEQEQEECLFAFVLIPYSTIVSFCAVWFRRTFNEYPIIFLKYSVFVFVFDIF